PKAQITVQDNPKRLSSVAHAEDHDVISSTLEKLEATTPEPQKRNLKVYSVTATQKSRFQSIAAGLATELTGMQVIADSQPGELAIWATELQHQVVDEVLAQLQKSLPPEQQSKLIVYPLEKVDPASVTTVLTTLFPDASITADVKGSRILVHAKPQVHEAIRSAVEQLDTDVPEAREIKLMAYPVRGINAVAAQQLIQTEFPEVTIIQDTVAESLIVRGHARAHSRIADILDSFRSTSVQLENRKAVSYPSMFSDQSRANDFFSAAFPKARVIVDPGTRKMTVWASDAEHADILQAVTEMRRTDADGTEASLQTYDIRSLPYASLLAMVTRAVPEAQTVVTSDGFQLLAWASPDDQARIQNIVDQSRKGLAENGKTLEILETGTLNITVATQALSAAFPQISFIRDPGGKALMAWLDAEQTEKVRTVLQQLNESTVLNETRELRFYEIHSLGGNDVRTLLSATYPDTTFTPTADGVKLMAMVTVERDQQIQETLKKLSSEQPFQSGRTMKLYSIRYLGPSVTTVLAQTVPRASVNAGARSDQLAIVATEDDHSKVEAVLQQLRDTVDHPPEKTLAVFDISGTSPAAIQQVLQPLMDAEVQTTIDPTGRQLFVRAVPDKQEEIANVIRQVLAGVSPEKGRSTKTYNVGAPNADEAQEALQALFPDAKFVTDQDKKILVATALPEQHATIAEVIEQIRGKGLEGSLPQPEIYTLKNADVREAQGLVQSLYAAFGNVRASVNLQEKRLVVVATPEQQISIRKMIEELDRTAVESSENGLSTKTYNVGAPNADEAQEALQALFPDAKLVTDQDKKILVATARPEQHATIAEVIDQIRGKGLEGSLPQPEVYTLKNADVREAQGLVQSLYAAFGNVRASINLQEKRLVVVATPEQQISIRKMIEELDRTSEARPDHGLAVFQTKKSDGTAILEALKPLLPASAVVTWDRIGNQLFLSAPENELPALKEIVNSFISGQKDSGAVTQTYRMLPNEADEAQEALAALFPDATLVTDNNDEILVATATPDQQKTIQSVVEEMMKHRSGSDAPFAKAYPLKTSDGENTVQVLQNLFTRRDNVRLSWDEKAGSLIALATPAQQTSIKTFLDQLEPAESEFGPRSLEMYLLKNVSGKAAEEVVKSLLQGIDSAAKVTFDSDSDQLIVTTFSEGHSRVKQAIERLDRRKEREFDVIQLSVLDATSAQYSLEGIFSDNYSNMDHMPSIQADDETQQLLIRATPEQLREIRSLLIRMGESSLKVSTAEESASRNLRVIPMTGDVESRIQKVKNLWPKIRKNQIRILTPESLQGSHPGSETPDHKTTPEPASQPDKAAPEPNPAQFSLPPEALSANDTGSEGQTPEPAAQTVPETTKTSEDAASTAVTADSTVESNQELPDVVIVVGDRSVTIASDDAEALDQLESLLRATSGTGERSRRGRDFAIYQLQNAGAEETAKTIREIYESRAARKSFDDVIIVPEERLNSVIVYAGRSDLDRIEGLLEVMDSEQKPDSGRAFRTNVIPLKFTDAQRVENIIRGIYRTELAAGSARRPMEIPAGIPASVAAVIRQMNATASSPLLTIEVQRDTNSLIIKAPQELLTEVSEVVSQLDSTAETSRARGLTLVPLSKTNSTRAMRILSNLLNR
ncbi:MAG: secretin N-terminal domain-containing protein, partial [Planctomyces sp.]